MVLQNIDYGNSIAVMMKGQDYGGTVYQMAFNKDLTVWKLI